MQCYICFTRDPKRLLGTFALAARTVVNNLMGKEITVDAEVAMARSTLIATAYTHPLGLALCDLPLILWRNGRERNPTGKASRAARSATPGHLDPIDQGEQVMIRSRQMSRQDQREAT